MKYLSGGDLREVEVWADPTNSTHKRVWTAEDGSRIRFYDSDDGVWVFQDTPSANVLLDIFFLADGETGWAVGKGGVVLHTTDHGDNWTRLDTGYEDWAPKLLWGVYFFESGEGWLVGDGVFLHSEVNNFGSTWNGDVYFDFGCTGGHVPGDYEFYAIDFIQVGSAIRGVASAEPGSVFYTDDGINWTPSTCTMGDDLDDSSHEFEPWDLSFEPNPSSIAGARVYVCGGRGTHHGGVYLSTVGGGGWDDWTRILASESTETVAGSTFYGIVALPNGTAVTCGYGGTIDRRDTGGTWHDESDSDFTFPLNGVDSDGGSKLWCVGSMGYLRKSTDGGATWDDDVPFDEIIDSRLSLTAFVSESTGWTVAQFHRITKTTDGGCTWTRQFGGPIPESAEPTSCVTGIDFASSSAGVTVGCDAWVLYTTDGGANWARPQQTVAPAGTTLMDVASNGSGYFFIVGEGGVVRRSDNGGQSWASVSGPTGTPTLMSIEFYSSTKAFVAGYVGSDIATGVGHVWRLTNATSSTVTWEDVSPTFNGGSIVGLDNGRSLRGVAARVAESKIEAYACGNDGAFLKYNRITGKFEPLAGVYECDATTGVVSSPPLTPLRLKSVAMVPSTQLLTKVVASTFSSDNHPEESGKIVYFDGSSWSLLESQTTRSIVSWSFPSSSLGYGVGIGSQTEIDGSVADSIIVIWRP